MAHPLYKIGPHLDTYNYTMTFVSVNDISEYLLSTV